MPAPITAGPQTIGTLITWAHAFGYIWIDECAQETLVIGLRFGNETSRIGLPKDQAVPAKD